jgi:hypothetical protein
MTKPTPFDLAEALTDIRAVHDALRDALPVLLTLAADDAGWPDTLLTDMAVTVAQGVGRLDAAAGLLTDD